MPKYKSINNIPAKTFFDILESKDFTLLEPIEGEECLDEVFSKIYDDYFVKSDNPKSKRFLDLVQEIEFMSYKIKSIFQVMDFLVFNTTTQEIRRELLESLIAIGINIDLENYFLDEVKNVLQTEVGILQNDLSFLQIELENIQKENKESVFNFYESLVSLETALDGRNLDDNMVLIKFIEYEKLAVKKGEALKQRLAKNKH